MNFKIKKNLGFFLPVIILALASCSFNPNPVGLVTVEKEVNFNKKFNIQLKINRNMFQTKSNTSSEGQPSKSFTDIKSFSAFLTTDDIDPFSSGSNPNGNGFMINVNNSSSSGPVIINFHNVPQGGYYFAAIAAFDGVVGAPIRNNITEINNGLSSTDQKWAISQNNVMILPSGSFSFSDTNTSLVADLNLQDGIANRISFQVDLTDGNTSYTGVVGTNGKL